MLTAHHACHVAGALDTFTDDAGEVTGAGWERGRALRGAMGTFGHLTRIALSGDTRRWAGEGQGQAHSGQGRGVLPPSLRPRGVGVLYVLWSECGACVACVQWHAPWCVHTLRP